MLPSLWASEDRNIGAAAVYMTGFLGRGWGQRSYLPVGPCWAVRCALGSSRALLSTGRFAVQYRLAHHPLRIHNSTTQGDFGDAPWNRSAGRCIENRRRLAGYDQIGPRTKYLPRRQTGQPHATEIQRPTQTSGRQMFPGSAQAQRRSNSQRAASRHWQRRPTPRRALKPDRSQRTGPAA